MKKRLFGRIVSVITLACVLGTSVPSNVLAEDSVNGEIIELENDSIVSDETAEDSITEYSTEDIAMENQELMENVSEILEEYGVDLDQEQEISEYYDASDFDEDYESNYYDFMAEDMGLDLEEFSDSSKAPEGYEVEESAEEVMTSLDEINAANYRFPNMSVLLIEDNLPWKSDANSVVLGKLAPFDKVTTASVTYKKLKKYDMVVFANDQNYATYSAFSKVRDALEDYVEDGGILIMGACDGGWANGNITVELPGGVTKTRKYDYHNYVAISHTLLLPVSIQTDKC